MTAQQQILRLYDQWSLLTVDEGEAIQANDWNRVAQRQAEKWSLRNQIQELALKLEAEAKAGLADPNAIHKQIHQRVEQLIELEMENERVLTEERRRAEEEQLELQRSTRALRRIHRAYGASFESAWDSYS